MRCIHFTLEMAAIIDTSEAENSSWFEVGCRSSTRPGNHAQDYMMLASLWQFPDVWKTFGCHSCRKVQKVWRCYSLDE